MDALVLLRRGNKIPTEGNMETKCGAETEGRHPETAPPGDLYHLLTPNPDNIADAKKCLLTRAWYNCPLRGSARARPIQMQKHAVNHQTEPRDPNGKARGRTEGTEGGCKPHRKNNINQLGHPRAPRD